MAVVQTVNLFSFSIISLVQFVSSTSLSGTLAGLGLAKLFRVTVLTKS